MDSKEAFEIAERMKNRRRDNAVIIQRFFRKRYVKWMRRRKFAEKLCGPGQVFQMMKLAHVLRTWALWAQGENLAALKGRIFHGAKSRYFWQNGQNKHVAIDMLVFHDRLEVVDFETRNLGSVYAFDAIKMIHRGSGHQKNVVTIELTNFVRETYSLINATGFVEHFQRRFKIFSVRQARLLNRNVVRDVVAKKELEKANFRPEVEIQSPTIKQAREAVGDVQHMSRTLQVALDENKDGGAGLFSPSQDPWKDEWRAAYPRFNRGQTYEQWKDSEPDIPSGNNRNKIYLVPIGNFDGDGLEMHKLVDFLKAFLHGLQVETLPPMPLHGTHRDRGMKFEMNLTGFSPETAKKRVNKMYIFDSKIPIRIDEISPCLEQLLPFDGFLLFGVTMHDIQFGEDHTRGDYLCSLLPERLEAMRQRVGVISLGRLDPYFRRIEADIHTHMSRTARNTLLLRRSCMWVAQHVLLFFGMEHCIFHSCIMNGYVNLEEFDTTVPLQVCPVCLRKLMDAIGIQTTKRLLNRYSELRVFCHVHAKVFKRELKWYSKRTQVLEDAHIKHLTLDKLEKLFPAGKKKHLDRLGKTASLPKL